MSDHLRHHRDGSNDRSDADVARWSLLIDCCRPDSRDAFDPELVELAPLSEQIVADPAIQERYERSQQFDGAVRRALHDAPVPSDLAARLFASLESAREEDDASEAEVTLAPAKSAREYQRTVRWRSWVIVAASVIGLLGALAGGVFLSRDAAVGAAEVVEQSQIWRRTVLAERNAWKSDVRNASLASFPVDRRVAASPSRWRSLKTAYGQAVVYDLSGSVRQDGGRQDGDRLALLFVVASNDAFALPGSPPVAEPQSNTQGVVTGAWTRRDEKLLYVLVVEGEPTRFRKFVREDRLASLPRSKPQRPTVRRAA